MAEGGGDFVYIPSDLELLTPAESAADGHLYDKSKSETAGRTQHGDSSFSGIADRAGLQAAAGDRRPTARATAHVGRTHSLRRETSAHACGTAGRTPHGDSSFSGTAGRHKSWAESQLGYDTPSVDSLTREINRLQREIKSMSAKRSESNRDMIREGLAMSFSDETDCTSTACPPRTADKSGRMESESKQPRRSGRCDNVTRNRSDDRSASVARSTTEVAKAPVGVDKPSADSATDCGTVTETAVRGRNVLKPLKLEKFDGVSTPLETFLAKFSNCKRYNQ